MQKTLITRKELAERWGVNVTTIDDYEEKGYIRRVNLPGCQFSLASVEKLEYDGTDNLLIKKDKLILELQEKVMEYKGKLEKIKGVASV